MGRYMAERRETLGKAHEDFLWVEEISLVDHFMCQQIKDLHGLIQKGEGSIQISFHQSISSGPT